MYLPTNHHMCLPTSGNITRCIKMVQCLPFPYWLGTSYFPEDSHKYPSKCKICHVVTLWYLYNSHVQHFTGEIGTHGPSRLVPQCTLGTVAETLSQNSTSAMHVCAENWLIICVWSCMLSSTMDQILWDRCKFQLNISTVITWASSVIKRAFGSILLHSTGPNRNAQHNH